MDDQVKQNKLADLFILATTQKISLFTNKWELKQDL